VGHVVLALVEVTAGRNAMGQTLVLALTHIAIQRGVDVTVVVAIVFGSGIVVGVCFGVGIHGVGDVLDLESSLHRRAVRVVRAMRHSSGVGSISCSSVRMTMAEWVETEVIVVGSMTLIVVVSGVGALVEGLVDAWWGIIVLLATTLLLEKVEVLLLPTIAITRHLVQDRLEHRSSMGKSTLEVVAQVVKAFVVVLGLSDVTMQLIHVLIICVAAVICQALRVLVEVDDVFTHTLDHVLIPVDALIRVLLLLLEAFDELFVREAVQVDVLKHAGE
jgi:hypothetical protein